MSGNRALFIAGHTLSPMTATDRSFAVPLAAIAAVGVALRLLYLLTIGRHVTGIGDWFFYHWQANDIAAGRGFDEPFRLRFDHLALPSAGHPPLYPLVLSAVSALGGTGTLAHRALGLPLGACTIALVGLLGRQVGGRRVGLLAAGLCAVYPLMIATDADLMSETLYAPLVALVLLGAWRLVARPSVAVAALTGAVLGLAALTRSEALLLLPLLVWPVLFLGARRWGGLGVATLACVVVLAPWAIRNAAVFGRFVPISNNDSTVVAGANCDLTYHGINLGGWDIRCISPRRLDNEAAQAAVWRREGLTYARDHAGRLPVVLAVRVLRVWDLWQPRRQVGFAEGRERRTTQAGVAMYYVLCVLAAGGVVVLRRRRGWSVLVLLAPAVAVCVAALVGYGVPRLRFAFELPLLVLAASGVVAAWDARRRAWPRAQVA
jgi:4-amino-4-deoxy-L-arabinose transferase-like glycosyltransferase